MYNMLDQQSKYLLISLSGQKGVVLCPVFTKTLSFIKFMVDNSFIHRFA